MRIRLGVLAACVAALVGGLALPANAGTCPSGTTCPTTTTFTVTAGAGMTITVPDTAAIGTGTPGSAFSGQLGTVTVDDNRTIANATWTSTVSATNFTTGAGTPDETIPNTDIAYWSGPVTAQTGAGTRQPGQPTAGSAVPLGTPATAFSKTSGSGDNSTSWNPTLIVDVPPEAVAGNYTGTVTHSVA